MNKNLVFLVKFFAIFAFFQALLLVLDLSFLQDSIAGIEAGATGLSSAGNKIFFGSSTFIIGASCTGLVSSIVLGSIVFSLKKPKLRKKIAIFLAGSAALMLLNLARVYLVLWAGVNLGSSAAELFHVGSWFFTAALILFLWYHVTKKICRVESFEDFL